MTNPTRRDFLTGLSAAGVLAASADARAPQTHDPALSVFLSDIHCHGKTSGWHQHQHAILAGYVREVLDMRPLPARVVMFGDFSASCGWIEDFRKARGLLQPLADAGIELVCGMGNHDKRRNFAAVFPELAARTCVPDRLVFKFATPHADFILLDSLREKPGDEGNFVDGRVDGAQRAWLRNELATAKRPLFVGAHHSSAETGIRADIVRAPTCCGYIYGHEHEWHDRMLHDGSYRNSQTVLSATLPSSGYYGDVGYAVFRTFSDRAELTLRQTDYWFNQPWPGRTCPPAWAARVAAHRNASFTFFYEKPGNFYS